MQTPGASGHDCPNCGSTYTAEELADWPQSWRDQLERELAISRHTAGCPECTPDAYPGAPCFDGCEYIDYFFGGDD